MSPTTAPPTGQAEQLLDRLGVPYTLDAELDISKIDLKASENNQAREIAINTELVDDYKRDLKAGDVFPPIIVRKHGRKFVILSGNHRTRAHLELEHPTIPALVAEVETDGVALRIAYEDNAHHGNKPSVDERARHGAHLVDACGYSLTDAARIVNVSTASISQERSAASAFHRAKDLKVSPTAFAALPKASRYALSQLQLDEVFAQASRLAIDAQLSTGDVGQLCKQLKTAKTVEVALKTIARTKEERRADIQTAKGRTAKARDNGTRNEAVQFQRHLWGINEAAGPVRIKATCAGPDHQKRMLTDIDQAIAKLEAVRTELRKR